MKRKNLKRDVSLKGERLALKKARNEVVCDTTIESTMNAGGLPMMTLPHQIIKSEVLLVRDEEVCYVCLWLVWRWCFVNNNTIVMGIILND